MEDYKTKFIKIFWEYAPFIPPILLVAGVKFFHNKLMGKDLGIIGNICMVGLTVFVGLLIVPVIKDWEEKPRYIALILFTLLAQQMVTWLIQNGIALWEYLIKFKKPPQP